MRILYLSIVLLLCFSSCAKNDLIVNDLVPIKVEVIQRLPNTAIIKWTSPEDFTESALYDIVLDGRIIKTNLKATTDTLENLAKNRTYEGRVIAHTGSGDTTSAPFTLEKLDGFMLYKNYTSDGHLNCYDLYSGQFVWSSLDHGSFNFQSNPIVINDTLYIGSSNTGMWALNFETGKPIWNNVHGCQITPIYHNGVIYSVKDYEITAIDSKTGNTIWTNRYTLPNTFYHNPVISGNLLITGMQSNLIAINIADGATVWRHEFDNRATSIGHPVVYKDLIIKAAHDSKVYALNNQTGAVIWTRDFQTIDNNIYPGNISPIIYDNKLIVCGGSRGYFALNPLTGETIWQYADAHNVISPAAGNGLIFYSGETRGGLKQAVAIDASTGKRVWASSSVGSSDLAGPIFAKGRIYFWGIAYYATSGDMFITLPYIYNSNLVSIVENGTGYYSAENGMVQ